MKLANMAYNQGKKGKNVRCQCVSQVCPPFTMFLLIRTTILASVAHNICYLRNETCKHGLHTIRVKGKKNQSISWKSILADSLRFMYDTECLGIFIQITNKCNQCPTQGKQRNCTKYSYDFKEKLWVIIDIVRDIIFSAHTQIVQYDC